jgi:hypothetical protein
MNKIVVKIPQKTRAHRMLFLSDTPFKPKRVERKDLYKRKSKHPNRDSDG